MSTVLTTPAQPMVWPGLIGNLPGIYSGEYPPEYSQYNTQYPGSKEVIQWVWYDTQTYVSGTTVSLTFFQSGPGGRTIDLTNMDVAGQLAAPKAFLLRAPRFYVKQRPLASTAAAAASAQVSDLDNVAQLINTGTYSCIIGSKNYGTYPLAVLTAGCGVYGVMGTAAATVVDVAQNGWPEARSIFTLSKPQFLAPQINFAVTLTWPAPLTLAGGTPAGSIPLMVMWDGDLIRPVQ